MSLILCLWLFTCVTLIASLVVYLNEYTIPLFVYMFFLPWYGPFPCRVVGLEHVPQSIKPCCQFVLDLLYHLSWSTKTKELKYSYLLNLIGTSWEHWSHHLWYNKVHYIIKIMINNWIFTLDIFFACKVCRKLCTADITR